MDGNHGAILLCKSATNKCNTTQIIKANKPPMNTYAKSEMLLYCRMFMNMYNAVIDGTLLHGEITQICKYMAHTTLGVKI